MGQVRTRTAMVREGTHGHPSEVASDGLQGKSLGAVVFCASCGFRVIQQ